MIQLASIQYTRLDMSMVKQTLGKRDVKQLINLLRLKMPRSNITRYEMLSKLYYLKDELKEREEDTENKYLADEYLNKVPRFHQYL